MSEHFFFLAGFCRFCREDPGQIEFAALEQLENPDWHRDSVRVMNLYSKIKELVASLECPKKFTLKDLIRPDRDRTERFLGTILNFFLHKYVTHFRFHFYSSFFRILLVIFWLFGC